MRRVVAWFSCGAASAVATHLALKKHGDDVVIANIYVANEHEDNKRFLLDCENWYGQPITMLRDTDHDASVDVVIDRYKYLSNRYGANCTGILKKKLRFGFQQPNDLHIFGYTVEERHRATRAIDQNPELDMEFPLIDAMMSHDDCLAAINAVGIELPVMYKLGFKNNNCIGCIKSGSIRYWLRIKKYFPDVFLRRSKQERDLSYALCRRDGKPVFLDEITEDMVDDNESDIDLSCSLLCQIAISE